MATATYALLGVVSPTDSNNATLYTVGSGVTGGAVLSTIAVANTSGSAGSYRIFVQNEGAAAAQSNAIGYDIAISANDTVALTLGICLDANDVISVRTANANQLNFFAFGSEIIN
jgi:hypothetical protein